MKLKNKIPIAMQFARAKLFKRRIPVIVSWAITYRCNQNCSYCQWPQVYSEELTFEQARLIIDKLVCLKTMRVNLTGGEPLLRGDIIDLVDYLKKRNLFVCINSNGVLIPDKISRLKRLDLLNLSLEGPEEIHDRIRGPGGYAAVMAAIDSARVAGVSVKLAATLNNLNTGYLEYIINLAYGLKLEVTFQVVDDCRLGGVSQNPLSMKPEQLQEAIGVIISYKKQSRYKAVIGNSITLLEYLLQWQNTVPLKCASGNVVFRLTPDAKLFPCAAATFKDLAVSGKFIDLKGKSLKEIEAALRSFNYTDMKCICSCSNRLTASLLWNMKPGMVKEVLKM